MPITQPIVNLPDVLIETLEMHLTYKGIWTAQQDLGNQPSSNQSQLWGAFVKNDKRGTLREKMSRSNGFRLFEIKQEHGNKVSWISSEYVSMERTVHIVI